MTDEELVIEIIKASEILKSCNVLIFTRQNIITLLGWKYPGKVVENTVNPHIQAMTKNLKGGAADAICLKGVFESLERGKFRLSENYKEILEKNGY